jgi:bifunctional ADP-heptose synthase (sugar kinase/adenylyltransferase)
MENCDVLHVALNSDRYIIKNKRHLLSCLDDRKKKIRNFGVSEIHSFIEDTPINLINEIKPKIIFVGDDYPLEKVAGHKECKYWGGSVKIIERIPGFSSTKIRQKNT